MDGTPTLLTKGALIGLSIAAPVGPIGILCIRRSLAFGQTVGLVTGLGAATADALYGAIAAFGLTAISRLLISERPVLGIIGGVFLCYLGLRTVLARPRESADGPPAVSLAAAYGSTLVLTLTNPMTILSFIAVFAGLGLGASPDTTSASVVVAGVFLGSALWWLILSGLVAHLRSRLGPAWLRGINLLSGSVILAFGLWALAISLR